MQLKMCLQVPHLKLSYLLCQQNFLLIPLLVLSLFINAEYKNTNGVASDKIHFELFTSPTESNQKVELSKNTSKIDSNVTIILDGDEIDLSLTSIGENVLDAAQKAGADLPFACKGGVCCTCKAKIIEGSASMDVNYGLEPDEVEAGYILTCQAHPTSNKLVISFDD